MCPFFNLLSYIFTERIYLTQFSRKLAKHGERRQFNIRRRISVDYVSVMNGTCCWKISDRNGNFHEFGLGENGIPTVRIVKKVEAFNC